MSYYLISINLPPVNTCTHRVRIFNHCYYTIIRHVFFASLRDNVYIRCHVTNNALLAERTYSSKFVSLVTMFEFQKVSFVVLLIATLVEEASSAPYCTNCLGEYCSSSSNCAKDQCCSNNVCSTCNTQTSKSVGLASGIIVIIIISVLVSVAIPVAITVWCCCFATSAAARRSRIGFVVSQPNAAVVDQIRVQNLLQANQGPIPVDYKQ